MAKKITAKLKVRPRGTMPPPISRHPDLKKQVNKEISRTTKVEDEDD